MLLRIFYLDKFLARRWILGIHMLICSWWRRSSSLSSDYDYDYYDDEYHPKKEKEKGGKKAIGLEESRARFPPKVWCSGSWPRGYTLQWRRKVKPFRRVELRVETFLLFRWGREGIVGGIRRRRRWCRGGRKVAGIRGCCWYLGWGC